MIRSFYRSVAKCTEVQGSLDSVSLIVTLFCMGVSRLLWLFQLLNAHFRENCTFRWFVLGPVHSAPFVRNSFWSSYMENITCFSPCSYCPIFSSQMSLGDFFRWLVHPREPHRFSNSQTSLNGFFAIVIHGMKEIVVINAHNLSVCLMMCAVVVSDGCTKGSLMVILIQGLSNVWVPDFLVFGCLEIFSLIGESFEFSVGWDRHKVWKRYLWHVGSLVIVT